MVHIKVKRPLAPTPFLQPIINKIVQADNEQALLPLLESFDTPFDFERNEERNLVTWHRILNRFDELLERYVTNRDIFNKPHSNLAIKAAATAAAAADAAAAAADAAAVADAAVADAAAASTAPASRVAPSSSVSAQNRQQSPTADETTDGPPTSSTAPAPATPDATDASSSPPIFLPSPYLVVLILRVTQRLLANASDESRHFFNSTEHIVALFSDDSSAIIISSLEILHLMLHRSHKTRAGGWMGTMFDAMDRVFDLALGWGGRENSLGLLECCSSSPSYDLSPKGSELVFDYEMTNNSVSNAPVPNVDGNATSPAAHSGQSMYEALIRRMSSTSPLPRTSVPAAIPLPPTPLFRFRSPSEMIQQIKMVTTGGVSTVHMPDVGSFKGTEFWLLTRFGSVNGIPKSKWFSFLCAFRRAKRFSMGRVARIEAAVIRLLALTIVFQIQPMASQLEKMAKEPELILDIVAIARCDAADGLDDIPNCLRIAAVRCISAMATDRHRIGAITAATGVHQHHGMLPSLLRTEISSILGSNNTAEMDTTTHSVEVVSSVSHSVAIGDERAKILSSDPMSLLTESGMMFRNSLLLQTTLLSLVQSLAVVSGTAGATSLANSGVLSILIPLLSYQNVNVKHTRLLTQAVRTMQAIIDGSAQTVGCQLFRDQDGLNLVAERIAFEVHAETGDEKDISAANEAAEVETLKKRGESRELYERLAQQQMTAAEALEHQPPSASTAARGQLPYSQWYLLRTLHQLLVAALGSGGNEVRELVVSSRLPLAMRKILGRPFTFGGSLFYSAASVTTDIAHAEPTATAELVKAGIAQAVLKSVNLGLPPCGEAVRCVPNLIAALCLAPSARDIVVGSSPMKPYLLRLATPFYARSMHGEIPTQIGNSLDELMRHVEALRSDGNRAMCEYLRMSAIFVADTSKVTRSLSRHSSASSKGGDVDGVEAEKKSRSDSVHSSSPSGTQPDSVPTHTNIVLLDKMKLAIANNSCRLAGFAQASAEHQEGIASHGGLENMIKLRLAPALACDEAFSRDSHSVSRYYPTPMMSATALVTALKSIANRHGTVVLKCVFKVLCEDATEALRLAKVLNNRWLPEEDALDDEGCDGVSSNGMHAAKRKELRAQLDVTIRKLRVAVVILSGLTRGGPGSSSIGVWEMAGGAQVATILSAVERAARCHLARVYTGLTLSANNDSDFSASRLTAAADPVLKPLRPDQVFRVLGDTSKAVGCSMLRNKRFEEICKSYEVPPESHITVRLNVNGLAWQLVTFVIAAQKLYGNLSRGMSHSTRRHGRDPSARYGANAKSLATSIGRIFVLHLRAAIPLWKVNVLTMGKKDVVAAWDYVRGILIEVKGAIFEESRLGTQGLILKSFFEAGGGEALVEAVRPSMLLQVASPFYGISGTALSDEAALNHQRNMAQVEELMKKESITTCSAILALGDFMQEMEEGNARQAEPRGCGVLATKNEDETSLDSVTNQARVLSRLVVGDAHSRPDQNLSKPDLELRKLLTNRTYLASLKESTEALSKSVLKHFGEYAVRRAALDSWQTLWNFLFSMASCPGLSASNSSPTEPASASEEWAQHDIRRTSLTIVLQLLGPVSNMSRDVLSVYSSEGTALTDILGIVHSTSANYQDLCQKPAGGDGNLNMEDWEDFLVPPEEAPMTAQPLSPDPAHVQNLVEMGFSERRARRALRSTPGNLQHAAEWLLTSQNVDNSSDGSEGDGDRLGNEAGDQDGAERTRSEGDATNDDDHIAEDEFDVHINDDNEGDGDVDVDDSENGFGRNTNEDGEDDSDDRVEPVDAANERVLSNDESGVENNNQHLERHTNPAAQTDNSSAVQTDSSPPEGAGGTHWRGRDNRNNAGGSAERPRPSRSPSARLVGRKSDKVGEERATVATKPVPRKSVESDGLFLLNRCIRIEMSLLRAALIAGGSKEDDVKGLTQIGCHDMVDGDEDEIQKIIVVNPISVDKFKSLKKDLFSSLTKMTKEVLDQAVSDTGGSHLPYVAIELLSALHKDGSLSEEDIKSVGSHLAEMLALFLTGFSGGEDEGGDSLKGQTVVLWSHFGGWKGRKGLANCAAFQLALGLLQSIVDGLNGGTDDIEEASEPIEKLRITEGGMSKLKSGKKDRELSLRAATAEEVLKLGQITTCLLLLDARVRYSQRDKIGKGAFDAADIKGVRGEGKKANVDGDKKVEKMETDVDGVEAAENGIEDENEHGSGETEQEEEKEAGNDVEMKVSDEEMLEKHRNEAAVIRKALLDSTKKTVMQVMHLNGEGGVMEADADGDEMDETEILMVSLRVLKMLRRVECGDAMIAVLQLLGALTRSWQIAEIAVKEDIVSLLLCLPHLEVRRVRSVDSRSVRMLVRTILRHVVEDSDTLLEGMKSEIREVASGSTRPPRSSKNLKSLIEATSPLAARDMACYVTALHESVTASGPDRSSQLEVVSTKSESRKELEAKLKKRPNVKLVVEGLCGLVVIDDAKAGKARKEGSDSKRRVWAKEDGAFDLVRYALKTLSEIVEFSRVAAVAFTNAGSPSREVKGSALDYIVQKLLPLGMMAVQDMERLGVEGVHDAQEVSALVERLFASLCTKGAGSHVEAVGSFARAVTIEAEKEKVSAGLIRGVAQCFAPGTRSRVMRAVLKSDLGNDLARCLAKLDVGGESNGGVCVIVLRALSLIGQAATHMARYGDHVGDDVAFGGRSGGGGGWMSLRDRDDFLVS